MGGFSAPPEAVTQADMDYLVGQHLLRQYGSAWVITDEGRAALKDQGASTE